MDVQLHLHNTPTPLQHTSRTLSPPLAKELVNKSNKGILKQNGQSYGNGGGEKKNYATRRRAPISAAAGKEEGVKRNSKG